MKHSTDDRTGDVFEDREFNGAAWTMVCNWITVPMVSTCDVHIEESEHETTLVVRGSEIPMRGIEDALVHAEAVSIYADTGEAVLSIQTTDVLHPSIPEDELQDAGCSVDIEPCDPWWLYTIRGDLIDCTLLEGAFGDPTTAPVSLYGTDGEVVLAVQLSGMIKNFIENTLLLVE